MSIQIITKEDVEKLTIENSELRHEIMELKEKLAHSSAKMQEDNLELKDKIDKLEAENVILLQKIDEIKAENEKVVNFYFYLLLTICRKYQPLSMKFHLLKMFNKRRTNPKIIWQ
jgi:hypothetical protein